MRPKSVFSLALLLEYATADVYWQFPCGGNNRLNEPKRAVQNDNRLFDSQNNNRHGCNKNDYEFYVGTELDLTWTIQHSCGPDGNVACEGILQYACTGENPDMRDGQTTDTIPNVTSQEMNKCAKSDCDKDAKYGHHEDSYSYMHTLRRERNMGLFTADQNLKGKTSAQFTRQQNKGTRYGYESPEERDHYPYWGPTMWTDIAVMTDDTKRCNYYKANSENVKGRSFCYVPENILISLVNDKKLTNQGVIPITESGCNNYRTEMINKKTYKNANQIKWTTSKPKNPKKPVHCLLNPNSRDNHHGNEVNSRYLTGYKWTVPNELAGQSCSIRLRYNISSPEFDNWNTDYRHQIKNRNDDRARADDVGPIGYFENFGPSWTEDNLKGIRRGYRHGNDKTVKVMPDGDLSIEMSYNTDQLARTFQDRTFMIKFKARPNGLPANAKIHTLNTVGNLGTNVEVYPNFEFAFHPENVKAKRGDYIHIQSSGSSNQPNTDDSSQVDVLGRVIEQTKSKYRSNLVAIRTKKDHVVDQSYYDQNGVSSKNIFGITNSDLKFAKYKDAGEMTKRLAYDGLYGDGKNYASNQPSEQPKMDIGKDIVAWRVDFGLIKLSKPGKYYFMDTHNHRFGSRTVKGSLVVN